MIEFRVVITLCAILTSVKSAGNGTKVLVDEGVQDNLAEASDFGNVFDLGSVSSGLLSSDLHFQTGFRPMISAPTQQYNQERNEDVKTITVTKNVPVPYTVTVEKRVPVRVEVPVDKPYPVYVPRPYQVVVEKKIPYTVKVPVPQPYTVEKHVPVPVKVHVARPYPVHVPAPYPVFVVRKVPFTIEKHIPVPVRVPVVRPYPVHVQVEKQVPYPVEKTVPYPVKVPVDRPVPVPVEKPYPVKVEKQVPVPVEKLVPIPVKIPIPIPVKIPVPIPVVSHYSGDSTNAYNTNETPDTTHQQYQYHHLGGESTEHQNVISETQPVQHEPIAYQGQQPQVYHQEQQPAYQQSQHYQHFQQHTTDLRAPQKFTGGHDYSNYDTSSVEQLAYANGQQDVPFRNDASQDQEFLPYDNYPKAIPGDYSEQKQPDASHIEGPQQDAYAKLRVQSDPATGKQESYFKIAMGSSSYKNSIHHGHAG